jgi:cholesterol transport system auxiliary component
MAHRARASKRAFLACVTLAWLASCAFERPESATATVYDFGPQLQYARANPAISGSLLIPAVRAPEWLDGTAMVYRLLYQDSARPRVYSLSRWAAEPALLVTDRLRSRFATVAGAVVAPGYGVRSDYTLRVELEDFVQSFDAPAASRATLRARATLSDTAGRKLLGQRTFEIDRPAAPNAAGGVKALTEATERFVEELVAWTVQTVHTSSDRRTP